MDMRNKQQFVEDVTAVLKDGLLEEYQIVEDASHTMVHLDQCHYSIDEKFTNTGKVETFLFEQKLRPSTDESLSGEEVLDYFYLGRGK